MSIVGASAWRLVVGSIENEKDKAAHGDQDQGRVSEQHFPPENKGQILNRVLVVVVDV